MAGLVLIPSTFVGFVVVGLYNFATFAPQYLLLRSVYADTPKLQMKPGADAETRAALPHPRQLLQSFRTFTQQPVALVIVAYACLWLTVLSPHGTYSFSDFPDRGFPTDERRHLSVDRLRLTSLFLCECVVVCPPIACLSTYFRSICWCIRWSIGV